MDNEIKETLDHTYDEGLGVTMFKLKEFSELLSRDEFKTLKEILDEKGLYEYAFKVYDRFSDKFLESIIPKNENKSTSKLMDLRDFCFIQIIFEICASYSAHEAFYKMKLKEIKKTYLLLLGVGAIGFLILYYFKIIFING